MERLDEELDLDALNPCSSSVKRGKESHTSI